MLWAGRSPLKVSVSQGSAQHKSVSMRRIYEKLRASQAVSYQHEMQGRPFPYQARTLQMHFIDEFANRPPGNVCETGMPCFVAF